MNLLNQAPVFSWHAPGFLKLLFCLSNWYACVFVCMCVYICVCMSVCVCACVFPSPRLLITGSMMWHNMKLDKQVLLSHLIQLQIAK